jgi:hypothetical protein
VGWVVVVGGEEVGREEEERGLRACVCGSRTERVVGDDKGGREVEMAGICDLF